MPGKDGNIIGREGPLRYATSYDMLSSDLQYNGEPTYIADGIYSRNGKYYVIGGEQRRDRGAGGAFDTFEDAWNASVNLYRDGMPDFRYDSGKGQVYAEFRDPDDYPRKYETPEGLRFPDNTGELIEKNAGKSESIISYANRNTGGSTAERDVEPDYPWLKEIEIGEVYYDPLDRAYRIKGTAEKFPSKRLSYYTADKALNRARELFDGYGELMDFTDLVPILQKYGVTYDTVMDKYGNKYGSLGRTGKKDFYEKSKAMSGLRGNRNGGNEDMYQPRDGVVFNIGAAALKDGVQVGKDEYARDVNDGTFYYNGGQLKKYMHMKNFKQQGGELDSLALFPLKSGQVKNKYYGWFTNPQNRKERKFSKKFRENKQNFLNSLNGILDREKLYDDLEDIYNSGDVDYNNHVPDGYEYNVTAEGEPYYTDSSGRRMYRKGYVQPYNVKSEQQGGRIKNAGKNVVGKVGEVASDVKKGVGLMREDGLVKGGKEAYGKMKKKYFDKNGNKTGVQGDIPSKQQGGQISQEEYEYYADIVAGAYQGDQERQNFIQQVFTAAQQGDEQAAQVATILQQIMEQYQQAQSQRNGGRLLKAGGVINHFNMLRNGVPLGYGVAYERRGGRIEKKIYRK